MNEIAIAPLAWAADAKLTLPGSKSEANRLLVAAALSGSTVRISGATASDDVRRLVSGLATLGFQARWLDAPNGVVEVGPRGAAPPARGELDCGNAGTALRFLVSVAAVTPGEWVLTGDEAMRRRPIGPLTAAWRQLGVEIEHTNGCPPVRVRGSDTVRGGPVQLDASVSSQFVSSLLLVGAHLPERIVVRCAGPTASREYASLTEKMLARFGVTTFSLRDTTFFVLSGYRAVPPQVTVGGDWSAMGVWTCLRHLTGSGIAADNLTAGSRQPDERLAQVLLTLEGDGDRTVDVGPIPDQFCNLAVVAAHRDGATTFTGGANLRLKESDRIAVMARGLAALGVRTEERPDGLVVQGGRTPQAAVVDPADDHRIAIAFALAGLIAPGVTIRNPGCVAKSYPGFWQDFATVQRSPRCVAVVGMRGAGKTAFARSPPPASDLRCVDTDHEFEQRFRPIADFVQTYGWHNFRDLEATLVAEALQPGTIVSTGGGAIEHPATAALLAEHAIVVWLDADAATLRERILADPRKRPSVTGTPIDQEIDGLLARRNPLFEAAASIRLDARRPTGELVAEALRRLRELRH